MKRAASSPRGLLPAPLPLPPGPLPPARRVNDGAVTFSGQFILNTSIIVAAVLVLVACFRRRWFDLTKSTRDVSNLTPVQWLILTMAGYLVPPMLLMLAVPSLRQQLGDDPKSVEFVATNALMLHGVSIAVLATILLVSRATTMAHERARAPRGILVGVLAAVLAAAPLLAIGIFTVFVVTLIKGAAPDVIAHELLKMLRDHQGDGWGWALMASAAIGAPIAEELLWRGGLQSALLRASQELGPPRPWLAIGITSALFALVHLSVAPVHALPMLFVLSLVLGFVRERTGSLLAPIVVHALFNMANLAALLLSMGS